TTVKDPARRRLFYHLVPPSSPLSDTRPTPPPSSVSSIVLGWLPAETPDDRDPGLNDGSYYTSLASCRSFMGRHPRDSQRALDDVQVAGELQLGNGSMHTY
ncbi:hypothetical protein F5148DRAFT_966923, partial [Russula earlei]